MRDVCHDAREGPKDVYVIDDSVIVNHTERKVHKGVNAALKSCSAPWYVTSEHAASEAGPLLTDLTGNDFPEDSPRLLAGLSPPDQKAPEALKSVLSKPLIKESGATVSYLHSDLKVLEAMQKHSNDSLRNLQLYLTDWGDGMKEGAGGIRRLDIKQFNELLSWGILMGVDDGCGDDK
ncbi:hypothetical protein WJX73_010717 [Symbiochloris irregularis]|uniref:Uncharacterized protein n=1 Tax=Symbiochloris irregularis TaxID=706552 RepID=A0AAW1P1K3_9CHLO